MHLDETSLHNILLLEAVQGSSLIAWFSSAFWLSDIWSCNGESQACPWWKRSWSSPWAYPYEPSRTSLGMETLFPQQIR